MASPPTQATGDVTLRAEHFSSIIKAIALQEFRMKQILTVDSSSSWIETYYRESATELTGGLGSAVRGIPRLANFPYGEVVETKVQSYMEKYGMEGIISWEDENLNNIPIMTRTLVRIGRAVANAVDAQIWAVMSESQNATNIQSVNIAAGNEWDSATVANRDPADNILNAIQLLSVQNFNPYGGNGYLVLHPQDFRYLMTNSSLRNAGTFFADDVITNGRVGKIFGLNIIVSPVVTADFGLVCIGQECGTWKEAIPLTVYTEVDQGIATRVRAVEMGVCQLTTPKAVVLLSNTRA